MGVIERGYCLKCRQYNTHRVYPVNEPYCYSCMEKVALEQKQKLWYYPPKHILSDEDTLLWQEACNEVASKCNHDLPYQVTDSNQ